MDTKELFRLAHLLYPTLATAEADVHAEALAERVASLKKGLLPEDEFAVTAMWLGNCAAIHRIDQTPMPQQAAFDQMRAPDFLAFPLVNGQPTPVLIEVKSRHDQSLNWSEKYLGSLRAFADLVRLPLLVAWKCGDLWSLVDHRLIEKNVSAYRLSLGKALTEDLMCVLFRDVRVMMNPEIELAFDFEMLDEAPGDVNDLIPAGNYRFKITGAGFYNRGEKMPSTGFMLFLAAPAEEEFSRTGKQSFKQIFRPTRDTSFTLSRVLVAQLSIAAAEEELNWHQILARGKFPSKGQELCKSLQQGIDEGFIRYVMDIVPQTWPDFLPKIDRPAGAD